MGHHSEIVREAELAARRTGRDLVAEVVAVQLNRIFDMIGEDKQLLGLFDVGLRAQSIGTPDEMALARATIWQSVERIEGSSATITYRETALLRGMLPYPIPEDPYDDSIAWVSEMIVVAQGLPSFSAEA